MEKNRLADFKNLHRPTFLIIESNLSSQLLSKCGIRVEQIIKICKKDIQANLLVFPFDESTPKNVDKKIMHQVKLDINRNIAKPPFETPWYYVFRDLFLDSIVYDPRDCLKHPFGVIYLSTYGEEKDPVETVKKTVLIKYGDVFLKMMRVFVIYLYEDALNIWRKNISSPEEKSFYSFEYRNIILPKTEDQSIIRDLFFQFKSIVKSVKSSYPILIASLKDEVTNNQKNSQSIFSSFFYKPTEQQESIAKKERFLTKIIADVHFTFGNYTEAKTSYEEVAQGALGSNDNFECGTAFEMLGLACFFVDNSSKTFLNYFQRALYYYFKQEETRKFARVNIWMIEIIRILPIHIMTLERHLRVNNENSGLEAAILAEQKAIAFFHCRIKQFHFHRKAHFFFFLCAYLYADLDFKAHSETYFAMAKNFYGAKIWPFVNHFIAQKVNKYKHPSFNDASQCFNILSTQRLLKPKRAQENFSKFLKSGSKSRNLVEKTLSFHNFKVFVVRDPVQLPIHPICKEVWSKLAKRTFNFDQTFREAVVCSPEACIPLTPKDKIEVTLDLINKLDMTVAVKSLTLRLSKKLGSVNVEKLVVLKPNEINTLKFSISLETDSKNEDTPFKIKCVSFSVFGKKHYHKDLPTRLDFVAKGLTRDELVAAFSQRDHFSIPNFVLSPRTPPIEHEIQKNPQESSIFSQKIILRNRSENEKIEIIEIKVFGNNFELICPNSGGNAFNYPICVENGGFSTFGVAKKGGFENKNGAANIVHLVLKYKLNETCSNDFGLYYIPIPFDTRR